MQAHATRSGSTSSIAIQLDNQVLLQQKNNRVDFLKELSSIKYLVRQGLSFRGHEDSEGNLEQLLQLRSEDIPSLEGWLTKKLSFSSDVNELITLFGQNVLQKLLLKIKRAIWFSVIADEATDLGKQEQITVCIRWVDELNWIHISFQSNN